MGQADVRGAMDRVLAELRAAGRAEATIRAHQVGWTGLPCSWLDAAWAR